MRYEPTLESIKQHPVPDWYHNAKLGIFIHWGLFSTPAWAPLTGELAEVAATKGWETFFRENPYAEWYLNSLRIDDSPTNLHHRQTYGPDFSYDNFAPMFNEAIKKWEPEAWADLFRQVGARYVVLVTKHHDGFLMWPSRRTSPHKQGYYASRNIVGELSAAVRAQGLRMGFYYSGGLDWSFNQTPITTRNDVYSTIVQSPEFIDYVDYHWRELIDDYQTELLWNDIGYPVNAPVLELFAYYYNTIPEGVINDRFGQVTGIASDEDEEVVKNPDGLHFDFTTPEYSSYKEIMPYKWESTRGIGFSFGYNQNEGPDSYLSGPELIRMFVDIVSKNGNLLLNVGPMADGTIPELQRQRLEGLGDWLAVNGEAIFDTRPWLAAEGSASGGLPVRFTYKAGSLYATLLGHPAAGEVSLAGLQAHPDTTIRLLGRGVPLSWRQESRGLVFTLPEPLPAAPAHALKLTPAPVWSG